MASKRAGRTPAARRPAASRAPRPGSAGAAVSAPPRSLRFYAVCCLVGLIAGEALLLLLSNLGDLAANAAFGSNGSHADGGIVGVATLLAVIAGGWIAARMAGRMGLYMGITVAIGFIVWGAVFQFLQEEQVVASSLSAGGRTLVDLGPMNMGSLISGDLLALFGGSVGGLLSRRH